MNVLICKRNENISTTAYRKKTNSDIYLHWHLFAREWKRGGTLAERPYLICTTPVMSKDELDHIRNSFRVNNGDPY